MPKFLNAVDLNKNELRNAAIQNLGTAPGSPVTGQIYCDTSGTPVIKYWNGSSFVTIGGGSVTSVSNADGTITISGTGTAPVVSVATGGISNAQVSNTAAIAYSKLNLSTSIVNADISSSAGIAYSKLSLGSSIVNTDISSSAAIAYSKLSLTGNIVNADINSSAAITYSKLNLGGNIVNADINNSAAIAFAKIAAPIAAVNFNSQVLNSVATPVLGTDAANKNYVDSAIQGLSPKAAVLAASTGSNVSTTSSPSTLDGVTLTAGCRILLKDQSSTSANGIYVYATTGGALVRASDMDIWSEVPAAYVWVEQGTANADTAWVCTSDPGGTLDSTAINWSKFANAATLGATAPISITANSITLATTARLVNNSGSLDLQASVATPGTYQSVTVDTYGRVTAGTNISATTPITFSAGVIAVGLSARVVNTASALDLASGVATPGTYQSVTVDTYGRVTAGAGLSASNGLIVQTATSTYSSVTITGTTNQITVANGSGVAGNPTLSFATGARAALVATGVYSAAGTGTATSFQITQATHGLGTSANTYCDLITALYDISSVPSVKVEADVTIDASGNVTWTFASSTVLTNYRFTIIGK